MLLGFVLSLTVCVYAASGQLTLSPGGARTDTPSLKPACQTALNQCLLDPCALSTCPTYSSAECRNCYKTCTAEYWNRGVEVTSRCVTSDPSSTPPDPSSVDLISILQGLNTPTNGASTNPLEPLIGTPPPTQCPSGQAPVQCLAPPCAVSSCPRYPTATCTNNYCGGCRAVFTSNGQDVTSQCSLSQPSTNATSPQPGTSCNLPRVTCQNNPCYVTSCPAYHYYASCVPTNCGGCYARYYYQGREVTSQCRPQLPPSRQAFNPYSLFVWPWMDHAFF